MCACVGCWCVCVQREYSQTILSYFVVRCNRKSENENCRACSTFSRLFCIVFLLPMFHGLHNKETAQKKARQINKYSQHGCISTRTHCFVSSERVYRFLFHCFIFVHVAPPPFVRALLGNGNKRWINDAQEKNSLINNFRVSRMRRTDVIMWCVLRFYSLRSHFIFFLFDFLLLAFIVDIMKCR